jgi:hypothetical protein
MPTLWAFPELCSVRRRVVGCDREPRGLIVKDDLATRRCRCANAQETIGETYRGVWCRESGDERERDHVMDTHLEVRRDRDVIFNESSSPQLICEGNDAQERRRCRRRVPGICS